MPKPAKKPSEFRVSENQHKDIVPLPFFVYWFGCDERAVAYCLNRHEAARIARALNEAGVADEWRKRAFVALAMQEGR